MIKVWVPGIWDRKTFRIETLDHGPVVFLQINEPKRFQHGIHYIDCWAYFNDVWCCSNFFYNFKVPHVMTDDERIMLLAENQFQRELEWQRSITRGSDLIDKLRWYI